MKLFNLALTISKEQNIYSLLYMSSLNTGDNTSVDKFTLQPVSCSSVHKHSSQGKMQCVTIHKHDFLNCLFSVLFLLFNCTITKGEWSNRKKKMCENSH